MVPEKPQCRLKRAIERRDFLLRTRGDFLLKPPHQVVFKRPAFGGVLFKNEGGVRAKVALRFDENKRFLPLNPVLSPGLPDTADDLVMTAFYGKNAVVVECLVDLRQRHGNAPFQGVPRLGHIRAKHTCAEEKRHIKGHHKVAVPQRFQHRPAVGMSPNEQHKQHGLDAKHSQSIKTTAEKRYTQRKPTKYEHCAIHSTSIRITCNRIEEIGQGYRQNEPDIPVDQLAPEDEHRQRQEGGDRHPSRSSV